VFDFPQTPPTRKIDLQPLTFSQVVSRTLQIYRAKFAIFFLPVLLITLFTTTVLYALTASLNNRTPVTDTNSTIFLNGENDLAQLGPLFAGYGVLALVAILTLFFSFLTQVIVHSLITYITAETVLGRPVTLVQALQAVRARLRPLIVSIGSVYLLVLALGLALTIILFACGFGIGLLVYVLLILTAFIVPVVMLERVGTLESIHRTWHLAKRRFWVIAGTNIVVSLFSLIIGLALAQLFGSTELPLLISLVTTFILTPIIPIAHTLLYFDARVRLENFSAEINRADMREPRPADVPSIHYAAPFMQQGDFVNLAILSVGLIIFIVLQAALTRQGGTWRLLL